MRVADRVANLPAYVFAEAGKTLSELKARGVDVINLGIGSPDLAPPQWIIDTLYKAALDPTKHGYAGYYGLPVLRKATATYYARRFGVELDPEREIVVLIGSKEGIFNVALAFIDPGDIALIPDPGYPTYAMGVRMAGGEPVLLPLLPEKGFAPDLASVPPETLRRARLLWLNYPNNPTAAPADMDFLVQAVAFAREHDLVLCYDNPYCDVTFDGYVAPSILQIPGAKDVVLEFNSLSKTYNMAGWRVGMAVGNAQAVDALARVKTNIDSGIFAPIQEAAAAALLADQSWLQERNAIYQARRDVVMDFLPAAGMRAERPRATLYVWARVPDGETSAGFSKRILEASGVWLTPGTAFGPNGEGYVRISLTTPVERLREAGERLRRLGESPV
ncbi:MAG: LL-diaminopimelate aminotransferase [Anaerolineae bacterium]|nr:LL-diaminopimelate aminotransferase [Anaerolineae bacterium]